MNLLFLIKGLGLGGAERHVVDSAIELKNRGYSVTIAYFLHHKTHFIPQLEAAGISAVCVGTNIWDLARLLIRLRPVLVHAHLPVPAFYARILKLFFDYKLVTTHHNVFKRQKNTIRILERIFYFLDDASVSCSDQVAASIPWNTKVIQNGIIIPQGSLTSHSGGLKERLGLSRTAILCLCTANLVPKKNHVLLLNAFKRACSVAEGVDAHLVLIGQDGTERAKLVALTHQLQAKDRVHFWGADDRAPNLAVDADIFCLTSDHEGLPLALLEAMASRLPAVVTDVGGMPGVVQDGDAGFVVRRGDVDGFADAIAKLLMNPQLRSDMGAVARRIVVTSFGLEAMVDQMVAVYEGTCNRA